MKTLVKIFLLMAITMTALISAKILVEFFEKRRKHYIDVT